MDSLFATDPVARLDAWTPAQWAVHPSWAPWVSPFLTGAEGQRLAAFVSARLAAGATVFPPQPLRALALTPLDAVRVVILGQDPYHGAGQAEGLAFSVAPGVKPPPSLRNILQEVGRDTGAAAPANGSLVRWAGQGVLLLNTCLTVEEGQPASHAGRGWEGLTDALIAAVARRHPAAVFMLWGAHAQAKGPLLLADGGHVVLSANHPSPLAARRPPRPFVGCGHFSAANRHLVAQGGLPINW